MSEVDKKESEQNSEGDLQDLTAEGLDEILQEVDPEFSKTMQEVREAGEATDVEIEPLDTDELQGDSHFEDENKADADGPQSLREKILQLKSLPPKEILGFFVSSLKLKMAKVASLAGSFRKLKGRELLGSFIVLIMVCGAGFIAMKSMHGRWLPQFKEDIVTSLTNEADQTWQVANESWLPLFKALHQPGHRYLFEKFVVNLRRLYSPGENNPMGFFEFYVDLNSQAAAIEVKARELELKDLLQRTIEGETHRDLSGERGKERLKILIRQELNQVLEKGWVEEVFISNIVLNP